MQSRSILLTVLFSVAMLGAFAQKKAYRIRSVNLVYDSARMQREIGINTGRNEIVNHHCTNTVIIIDEAANTITGHIAFDCKQCSKGFVDKTINLSIRKLSDDFYQVTDFHDPARGNCTRCGVFVHDAQRAIGFDFLYFYLGEQSTMFEMAPVYSNINGAIAAFDVEALTEFVEKGIDLNASYQFNGKNESPLNFLCDLDPWKSEKEQEMAKILLDKGVNVNITDGQGFTPLMKTLQNVNLTLYGMILQHHPDKNAKAKDGTTALKLAKVLVKKAEPNSSEKYRFEDLANSLKN